MAEQTRSKPASMTAGERGPELLRNLAFGLISIRRTDLGRGTRLFLPALLLRLAGAGLLAWVGWVHWVLWWHQGYRFIPTDGPFFLVDAIAGVVFAIVLLVWPRPVVGLASAAFVGGTIFALVISLTVGLFGFNEFIQTDYVVLALVVESITVVVLLAWTVLAARTVPVRPRREVDVTGWRARGRRLPG
jgi:MFS family permease